MFEGASGVGGTWWYNRYPGARVDAPSSPFYAYTFSKELVDEWKWAETQTAGPTSWPTSTTSQNGSIS